MHTFKYKWCISRVMKALILLIKFIGSLLLTVGRVGAIYFILMLRVIVIEHHEIPYHSFNWWITTVLAATCILYLFYIQLRLDAHSAKLRTVNALSKASTDDPLIAAPIKTASKKEEPKKEEVKKEEPVKAKPSKEKKK